LDEHLEEDVKVEEESIEQSRGEPPEHASELHECEYCSMKGRGRYTLHLGSIFLYVKDRKIKALADIGHVYSKCVEGLRENIVFLYRMMYEFKSKGYNVLVVRKAFDDDLYVYISGRIGERRYFIRGSF
jgi:hypothetical protein